MHERGKKTKSRAVRSATAPPRTWRTASQMASVAVNPKAEAASTAEAGRLRRVTSATARMAAGKAGKKAQRLPMPSWYMRAGSRAGR